MPSKNKAQPKAQPQPLSNKEVQPQPLSVKELQVLQFIEHFLAEQGVSPTYSEIKEHFGFASFNSVQRYLKQLQDKNYISNPGSNQKRALQVLHPSRTLSNFVADRISGSPVSLAKTNKPIPLLTQKKETPQLGPPSGESLSLPLLGRVAAGSPIEAFTEGESIDVPSHLIRYPSRTFALIVQGQSMIEDGILDGDIIFVQKQSYANNGETVVAMINNQATVKKFYLHRNSDIHSNPQVHAHIQSQQVELRPANSSMEPMWFAPQNVDIQGIVVGLIRRF